MSHEHYNALCIETNGNLAEATTRDDAWAGMKPIKDRNAVNQLLINQLCVSNYFLPLKGLYCLFLALKACKALNLTYLPVH